MPLLDSRVILRPSQTCKTYPVTDNEFSAFYYVLNQCCGWITMSIENGSIAFNFRVDSVTPTTATGKRIFIAPLEKRGTFEYGTLDFKKVGLNTLLSCSPDLGDKSGDVIIVCISGFNGGNENGMTNLVSTLRNRLKSAYGVNPNNIFHMKWNQANDSDPSRLPMISAINKEILSRSPNPSYLAIIGHSFGGWAACRLSKITQKVPDFVGLVDPVFGPSNTFQTPRDVPRGSQIINWYQNNGILGIRDCPPILRVPCSSPTAGVACGNQEVGTVKNRVRFLRTWNGTVRRTTNCTGPQANLRAYHTNIDEDLFVHRQIFDRINSDLRILLGSTSSSTRRVRFKNKLMKKRPCCIKCSRSKSRCKSKNFN